MPSFAIKSRRGVSVVCRRPNLLAFLACANATAILAGIAVFAISRKATLGSILGGKTRVGRISVNCFTVCSGSKNAGQSWNAFGHRVTKSDSLFSSTLVQPSIPFSKFQKSEAVYDVIELKLDQHGLPTNTLGSGVRDDP